MMHHEAGVRTVVAGGRPEIGPMQAVAGVRGAETYGDRDIDSDIQYAIIFNSSAAEYLPNRDIQLWITYLQFNLRDQIRKGEYFPLQFAYEAADCRIFYTPETFYNYTNLWKYAANAMWYNPALCVKDSTNHPSTKGTDTKGPSPEQKAAWKATGPQTPRLNASTTEYHPVELSGLVSGFTYEVNPTTFNAPCADSSHCSAVQQCVEVEFCDGGKWIRQNQCKQQCRTNAQCGNSQRQFICNPSEFLCIDRKCRSQGFCERISDRIDSRCKGNEPKLNPTLAVGLGTVVVNPGPSQTPRVKAGSVGGPSKEQWMKKGTLGGLILGGMAEWENM